MAVYLFTLHTYGSWLPDRARGYTRRGKGVLPADREMAGYYREDMHAGICRFDRAAPRHIIEAVNEHAGIKGYLVYAIATDPTHAHTLLGWHGYNQWAGVRRGIKYAISRRLNERVTRQQWLSGGGSRKRVSDKAHFTYLTDVYLPSHHGLTWSREDSHD